MSPRFSNSFRSLAPFLWLTPCLVVSVVWLLSPSERHLTYPSTPPSGLQITSRSGALRITFWADPVPVAAMSQELEQGLSSGTAWGYSAGSLHHGGGGSDFFGLHEQTNGLWIRGEMVHPFGEVLVRYWVLWWMTGFVGLIPILLRQYRLTMKEILRDEGRCPECAYDLRASQDRCPECGTPIPTNPTPAET